MNKHRKALGPLIQVPPVNRAPSFLAADLTIREIPASLNDPLINASNSYLRLYLMNGCSIIVTREFGWFHLSISNKIRDPTWLEISTAWYKCIPDASTRTGVLILPPLAEYINITEHCFQVAEIEARPDWPVVKGLTDAD